jgi:hypothetical protein
MARRSSGLRARRLRGRPSQGITGGLPGAFVTSLALVLVAGPGAAWGQGAAAGQPAAPPPFAPSAEKFPGNPPADAMPPGTPEPRPPEPAPTPPKWPGAPWPPSATAPAAPPAYPPPPGYAPPAAYPSPPAGPYPPPAAYPPSAAPPPYPPPPGGQVPGISAAQAPPAPVPPAAGDPQADRVVLLPTATTHPAGTFFVSNYELVIFQAGYAFTDSTQLSLTLIPAPSESLSIVDASVKTSLYRGGLVRAAAIGSVSGAAGKDVGLQLLGRAGGVVQVCTARRCDSSLSLSSNVMLAGALLIMVNGAGGIWRMSEHVSVLAELATMVPVGTQGGQFNGAALGGGVRLHYTHWGFDFAAMHALDSTADVTTIPFLAMTWIP